jgi:hypothetical protein
MQRNRSRICMTLLAVGLVALGLTASAQAKLTGEFTRFANCPYKNEKALKCLYSVTEGGEVVLGSKKVPIVNPVVLQGAYAEPVEVKEGADFYPLLAATNGVTLSKAPQPVPGGLAGLVNCKEIKEPILRAACELALENGVTGVNSTLELAKPASAVRVSENNLAGEIGTALELPVKFHLENPFLGSNCYVGSSSNPIIWKLSSGLTKPPAPIEPISGFGGEAEFLEGFQIIKLNGNVLADNAWAAPGVTGCGGLLVELLLNPVVNVSAGLPAAAGKNTAILKNTIYQSSAITVNENDVEHP